LSSTATLGPRPPAGNIRHDAVVIGLVGMAHSISHFSQLLLAPLFPWLKEEFAVSYAELGLLMSIFFVVSCAVQAMSGFVVDRFGPRPILFGGLALLAAAAFGFATSQSYWMLAFFSVVAGVGNGVFHPVDYTLLNRKVHPSRLGHAFSVHGITGSLGWALAPAMLVPIAMAFSWRVALMCAGALALLVIAILWIARGAGARRQAEARQPGRRPLACRRGQVRVPQDSCRVDVLRLLLFLRDGTERRAGLRPRGRAALA